MNSNLETSCKNLPDGSIPAVLQELFQILFEKIPTSELEGVPELDKLMQGGDDLLEKKVGASDGNEIGRALLVEFSKRPDMAPFVEKACAQAAKKMESRMIIPGLMEIGTLVMLSYLAMATSVSVESKNGKVNWKIVKKESPPEFMKSILTRLTSIVSRPGTP